MGIQGLIPFLKNATRPANIKEFKGCTVAIDSYCWLHRGAFACAEKLALGEKTDQYVFYCMKFINSLLSFGIKPIMVFDGCRLPSKLEVEKGRRERREANRHKAAQLLREGKRSEARDCLAQCIDITSEMALDLMKACRDKGVDCIVAPYEADAQLAYLARTNMAHIIITEDSDLVLFGCERVMFKMDFAGNGLFYERKDLNKALGLHPEHFTFDRFRYMCILSGCDYLANLPGIGLGKALKVFKMSHQPDVNLILKKLPSLLNMSSLVVPPQYIESFSRANQCFLYQLVFDPRTRSLLPLNSYPPDLDPTQLSYAGPLMSDEKAYQIALGNVNVNTGEIICDFDPDNFTCKTQGWGETVQQCSIWSRQYKARDYKQQSTAADTASIEYSASRGRAESTRGKEVVVKVPVFRAKRPRADDEDIEPDQDQLNRMYGADTLPEESLTSVTNRIVSPSSRQRLKEVDSYVEKLFPKASPEVVKYARASSVATKSNNDECFSSKLDKEITTCNVYSPCKIRDNDTDADKKEDHVDNLLSHYVSPVKPLSPSNHLNNFTPEVRRLSPEASKCGKENINSLSKQRALQEDSENDSDLMSPGRRRNVFAVSGSKVSKFNLNAPKNRPSAESKSDCPTTGAVEVKSRFFTAAKPRKETEFFRELKKECSDEVMQVNDGNVMKVEPISISIKQCEAVIDDNCSDDQEMQALDDEEPLKPVRQSPISDSILSCQKSRPTSSFTKLSAFKSDWRSKTNKVDDEKSNVCSKNTSSIYCQFKPVGLQKESIGKNNCETNSVIRCNSVESDSASESESPIPSVSEQGGRRGLVYDRDLSQLNKTLLAETESEDDLPNVRANILQIPGLDAALQEDSVVSQRSCDEDPLPDLTDIEESESPMKDIVKSFAVSSATIRNGSASVNDSSASGHKLSKLDRILTRPDVSCQLSIDSLTSNKSMISSNMSSDKKQGTASNNISVNQMIGWLAVGKTGIIKSAESVTKDDNVTGNAESPLPSHSKFSSNAVSQYSSGRMLNEKSKDRASTGSLNGARASGLSKNRVKNKSSATVNKQQSSISSFLQSNFAYSGRKPEEKNSFSKISA